MSTALLVVDVQYYCAYPGKGLYKHIDAMVMPQELQYYFERIYRLLIPNITHLQKVCRDQKLPVLFSTIESLTKSGKDRSLAHRLLGVHVPRGSLEAKVLTEVAPKDDEIRFGRTSKSPFTSTNIDYVLRNMGVSELVIVGLLTDDSIQATVRDAVDRGYSVTVVQDACGSRSAATHASALDHLKDLCNVVATSQAVRAMEHQNRTTSPSTHPTTPSHTQPPTQAQHTQPHTHTASPLSDTPPSAAASGGVDTSTDTSTDTPAHTNQPDQQTVASTSPSAATTPPDTGVGLGSGNSSETFEHEHAPKGSGHTHEHTPAPETAHDVPTEGRDVGREGEEKVQAEALTALRNAVDESSLEGVGESVLTGFYLTHNRDPVSTKAALERRRQWRDQQGVGSEADAPPNWEKIRKCMSFAFHGVDRAGRPVYMERIGRTLASKLVATVTVDEYVTAHVFGMEYLWRQCVEATRLARAQQPQGSPPLPAVDTITTVFDLSGLGFHHRRLLPYLKAVSDLDTLYYPGFVAHVLFINTPWIWAPLYSQAQEFLSPLLKSKVVLLRDRQELLEYISEDNLPELYGGTCRCEKDGCLPTLPASDEAGDEGLEVEVIEAGTSFERVVHCGEEGGTFSWYFKTKGGYDLGFSARIESDLYPQEKKVFAKMPSRCTTSKGLYTSKGACTLTFQWDNSFSWMRSKRIFFHASVNQVDLMEAR